MDSSRREKWVHYWSVATLFVALLPIIVGALVTTKKAGMAFADWPTSDGHGMFAYPWLQSVGDQFLEHGHRLAGVLIGLFSIGLVILSWTATKRRTIRVLSSIVLLGVIAQGLLGGARVLADDPRLAWLHGNLASWVFAIMGVVALVSSSRWSTEVVHIDESRDDRRRTTTARWTMAAAAALAVQYALGGWIRHLGAGLYEHVGFAGVATLIVVGALVVVLRSGDGWLKRPAWALAVVLACQLALGASTWVFKYGWAPAGVVGSPGASESIALRTAHTVVGLFLILLSTNLCVRAHVRMVVSRRSVSADVFPSTVAVATGGPR